MKSAESAMGWWTMTSDEGFAAQEAMAAVKKVKLDKAASSKECKAAKKQTDAEVGQEIVTSLLLGQKVINKTTLADCKLVVASRTNARPQNWGDQ